MREVNREAVEQVITKYKSSWTNNEELDQKGAILIKNVVNGAELIRETPNSKVVYNYKERMLTEKDASSAQVKGSIETYNYPDYQYYHRGVVKTIIENAIGRKLYPTYYYDRFYFKNQALTPHSDRDACEISASMLIRTTLENPWPLYVLRPVKDINDLEADAYNATDKDLIVYKGAECVHWRDNMPRGEHTHHQIFFHYILQDGNRAYCAYDNGSMQ